VKIIHSAAGGTAICPDSAISFIAFLHDFSLIVFSKLHNKHLACQMAPGEI
jgi:hypothetical protein